MIGTKASNPRTRRRCAQQRVLQSILGLELTFEAKLAVDEIEDLIFSCVKPGGESCAAHCIC